MEKSKKTQSLIYNQPELSWIKEAKAHIGLKEIKGLANNPVIVNWLVELGAWWREDESPWCGIFVAHCLKKSNRELPKHYYRARAYLDYGKVLLKPAYGCIVVFPRKGGGHVGFVVGKQNGFINVLGGNQNNEVNITKYPAHTALSYRWIPTMHGRVLKPYKRRYEL